MILKIGNTRIERFNDMIVTLRYDSVASTFSFKLYFDPEDPDHRAAFKPATFKDVTIEHNGQLLLTGILLGYEFEDKAEPELITVYGYSKTGVLEDCSIPDEAYPLQSNNINLKNIAEKIVKPFGIKLTIDPAVSSKTGSNYKNSTGGETQTCKAYLSELANQKHVILTHNEKGELVLTEAKTSGSPIYDFDSTTGSIQPATRIRHSFDGQGMHSKLHIKRDATRKKAGGKADVTNPYVQVFRPKHIEQSSGDDTNTEMSGKNVLSGELKGIKVSIEMQGWELDGKIVRPNNMITVRSPRSYLYNKTRLFIEQVDFTGNNEKQTATLTCYVPEVYDGKTPKNIYS